MRRLYEPLTSKGCPLIETDIATAELAKHASNAFLALKISFANALARICELASADVTSVANVMGSDPRIGRQFLDAGLGYGGYCFPKDVAALERLAEQLGYPFPLLGEVRRINEETVDAAVSKVTDALWNLEEKRIAMLGLSFKPGTDDVRFSPALALAGKLIAAGASVVGYDPSAGRYAKEELQELELGNDPYDAAAGAHCLVLATEWPEFRELDLRALRDVMVYPVVVDTRNALDPAAMIDAGFSYYAMGRPSQIDGSRLAAGLERQRDRERTPGGRRRIAPIGEVAMGVRAVVTGGAGFVGSHLCERLLAEGWSVVCVDSLMTGSTENLAGAFGDDRFAFQQANVSERIDVDGPVDWVLHFASPASPRDYLDHPIQTLKVGSLGTMNSLGLARAKGAGLLLASTSEVYGDPLVHPQPESYWGNVNPIGPRSVYDEAKRYAEAIATAYHRVHGIPVKIVRIFNTYGPRMRENDGRAVPAFISQALRGEPITVHGTGSQTRSLCYVDDLVEGLWRFLSSEVPGPLNLGNPHEVSVLELAELIRSLTGSASEIVFEERPADDPEVRCPDITKAREELGWEPGVSLEDGLMRTIAHWPGRAQTNPERSAVVGIDAAAE